MQDIVAPYFGPEASSAIDEVVNRHAKAGIFILVDENTKKYCYPQLAERHPSLSNARIVEIPEGEKAKNFHTAVSVWEQLSEKGALRDSLLFCLGGGVLCDVGGFTASSYRRGMPFVMVPTTLMAMVDAAIGGKNGINLAGLKNQIGTFSQPESICVFPDFLKTLPARHILSGFSEMIKHALIDGESFEDLKKISPTEIVSAPSAIKQSALIKMRVVKQDPLDKGIRNVLNFGHTIGHAFETWSAMHMSEPMLHGEAVAAGLICEAFISVKHCGLPISVLYEIVELVMEHFRKTIFYAPAGNELIEIMLYDKKVKQEGEINFTLLGSPGAPLVDQYPSESLVRESLHYYVNL
ncbi:MAG TPA: 3-dehydroquinate synthase family protein [Bacteroidales bacterium]|nr:3-dehydroquinate synthase family protein [Bacteroidales bacterium]HPT03170.1 3-dehydroquinate synthase family protein [Bacteroidales bacterium]